MIRYIIKRAALAVGIIFSISLITFFILNVIPGDPVAAMLGEFADADKIAQVKAQMGLDTPLPVQYFNWLKDLLHGDMGTSYFQKKPVITLILQAFHYTVIMATAAYIFQAVDLISYQAPLDSYPVLPYADLRSPANALEDILIPLSVQYT